MTRELPGRAPADRVAQALAVPLQHALGARLIDPADPAVGVVFRVSGLASSGAGGVHSGALTAMLELAAYLALLPELAPDEHAVTHATATQLVAAARDGEEVEVTGTVERRTRRIAFLTVTAAVGDRLVATAQITKSVVPAGASSAASPAVSAVGSAAVPAAVPSAVRPVPSE